MIVDLNWPGGDLVQALRENAKPFLRIARQLSHTYLANDTQ